MTPHTVDVRKAGARGYRVWSHGTPTTTTARTLEAAQRLANLLTPGNCWTCSKEDKEVR